MLAVNSREFNIQSGDVALLAVEIADLHRAVVGHMTTAIEKAKQIGELLTAQKSTLKHGTFGSWIEENCPFSQRMAQRYMAIHRDCPRLKNDTMSLLAPPDPLGWEDEFDRCRKEIQRICDIDRSSATDDELVQTAKSLVMLKKQLRAILLSSGLPIGELPDM